MENSDFIKMYREAFGQEASLPICFGYSDEIIGTLSRANGCVFSLFGEVRDGNVLCVDKDSLTCGGGRLYAGFAEMSERIPEFVAKKERYKQSPEMVKDYVDNLGILPAPRPYLWFARIDRPMPQDAEGVIFIANPDRISGLAMWACFDNNAPDAVAAPFGSGCCSAITMAVKENHSGGSRVFLGMFDPSARVFFRADELTLAVPMCRFRQMRSTMSDTCLFGPPAWQRLKQRMQ